MKKYTELGEDSEVFLDSMPSNDIGELFEFFVSEDTKKIRLDAFLSSVCDESRSKIKKLVEQGYCRVDGVLCSSADMRLKSGQTVCLQLPAVTAVLEPEDGPLDILYSDEDIAVINKPYGLTMHPCPSCPHGTLVHRLLRYFPQLSAQEGVRPGIVHRLDKDTSGLVVIALSEKARLRLIEAFAAREVHKTYLAVTRGIPDAEGMSELPVGRHPICKTKMAVIPESRGGRYALTRWKTLYASSSGKFALLAIRLFTGRTHQIRVHMAESGHPLWGDAVYGPQDKESPALRQLLHAWKLEFIHPISGESLNFCCPPPEDFIDTMLSLERCTKKVILTGMPGCGKSAVLEVLSRRGIPVWSADKAVAAQYKTGADGWHLMRQRWGSSFLHDDGSIDRTKLTELLSVQPGMRKELEKLIHPLILLSMKNFFTRASDKKAEIAVAEVPLWFETGWQRPEGASIAVIACNRNIRWDRIRKYRSWSEEKIASIESWQWSQKEKIAAADFVIQNEGSLQNLENEADVFLAALSGKTHSEEDIRKQYWRSLWK